MYCYNCGNGDRFILSVELAARTDGARFEDPSWTLGLTCDRCASAHVAGDPASLL